MQTVTPKTVKVAGTRCSGAPSQGLRPTSPYSLVLDANTQTDKHCIRSLELARIKLSDRILSLPGVLTDDSTGREVLRSKAPV